MWTSTHLSVILECPETDVTTADIKQEESKRARARIAQFYLLLGRRNHFELLGIGREADDETVRAAFKELAKRWHTDAFANIELGEEQAKLDEIFQRLNEAYETLTTPKLREEYTVYLDRSAKGLATDVHGVLRAEGMVDEALMDLKRKQWSDAVEKLREARKLNPDDPLYDVHYAWALYHLARSSKKGSHKDAVNMLRAATKRQENLALAYQYLGQIYFNGNNYEEAKKWWKVCLQYEPRNVDAQRGVRLINTRAQKREQSGITGFFNKLVGKK